MLVFCLMLMAGLFCAIVSIASAICFHYEKGAEETEEKGQTEDNMMDQEIIDEIKNIVDYKVSERLSFTAWDVTQDLREQNVKGKHADFKQVVHQLFEHGEMLGYQRELRNLGSSVPAWYYFHQADYCKQQYASNTATLPSSCYPRPMVVTTLHDKQTTSVTSVAEADEIIARPDKRGTVCVPATAIKKAGLEIGDRVVVTTDSWTQTITLQIFSTSDMLKDGCRLYHVDKHYNVRITASAIDDAWAWAHEYKVEVLDIGLSTTQQVMIKPR